MMSVSIKRKKMDIEKILYRLSKEIVETNLDNPLILGIPNRGDILANRISVFLKSFGYEHNLEKINYHPFRDDLDYEVQKTKLFYSPNNRNIILVDDVIYTGRTLRASIEAVIYSGRPKSISLLCLVDRGHRELPLTPKFVGKNIPTKENEYVSVLLSEIDNIDRIDIKG